MKINCTGNDIEPLRTAKLWLNLRYVSVRCGIKTLEAFLVKQAWVKDNFISEIKMYKSPGNLRGMLQGDTGVLHSLIFTAFAGVPQDS